MYFFYTSSLNTSKHDHRRTSLFKKQASKIESAQTIVNVKITSSTLRASKLDKTRTTTIQIQKTKNKVLTTTSLETKFQVPVIGQPEEKDNNETYRKGVRQAQSLSANLKKPRIVIALHNTLFFYRGLFKGRSHPKSPCVYLLVLNNLIYKSGFQNIAIRRELRRQ